MSKGELAPGERFAGRYRIDQCLGRGGMGTVYRVADEQLDEVVALKIIGLGQIRPEDLVPLQARGEAGAPHHPSQRRTHLRHR